MVLTKEDLNDIERVSIRDFVARQDVYFHGRVLDFGCGIPPHTVQPYRGIIERVHSKMGAGEYVPFDLNGRYASPDGKFDCVLMTQVLQYLPYPLTTLSELFDRTKYLVITYPTSWPEVETTDLWRFTKAGVERLLSDACFKILIHEKRWSLPYEGWHLAGGYGIVAENLGGAYHP